MTVQLVESPLDAITERDLDTVSCDLCGSADSQERYEIKGRRIPIPFRIVQCSSCGLYYVNPRLPARYAPLLYSEEYYDGQGLDTHFRGDSEEKRFDCELLLRSLGRMLGRQDLRILEVGGGEGLCCQVAGKLGMSAMLCDISEAAVRRARARGIECFLGELSALFWRQHYGSFDAVIALEVIEHVYSPRSFLEDIARLLRPGGIFTYTTGNVGETRFQGKNWGYFEIPEAHLYYFSESTIRRYFREAGFSGVCDPYSVYYKRNTGVRILEKMHIAHPARVFWPESLLEKLLYRGGFRAIEAFLGRTRLPWAVK